MLTWIGLLSMIYFDKQRAMYDRLPNWAAIIWFFAAFIPIVNWPLGIVSMFSLFANEPVRAWLVAPVRKKN